MKFTKQALALLVLIGIGAILRISQPPAVFRSPDEGVYAHYSRSIVQNGVAGYRNNIKEFNQKKLFWNYPTPYRASYLALLASTMKLTGDPVGERSGVALALIFSIASLAVFAWGAYSFFGFWPALFGLLFLCFSPMELMFSRRIWQDGIVSFLCSVLIFLCCRVLKEPKKYSSYLGIVLVGTYLCFFKETGFVAYGLIGGLLTAFLLFQREWKRAFFLCLGAVAVLAPSVWAFIYLTGGIPEILAVTKNFRFAALHNPYMNSFQGGSWDVFCQMFWLLSPLSFSFTLLAVFIFAARPFIGRYLSQKNNRYHAFIFLFVVCFYIIACIPENYKNARLLSPLYASIYLLAGIGASELFLEIKKRTTRVVFIPLAVVLGLIAGVFLWKDFVNFQKIFVKVELNDLVLPSLKDYSIYRIKTPFEKADALASEELFSQIPKGAKFSATYSFIDALDSHTQPYLPLHSFIGESGRVLSMEEPLPRIVGPVPLPQDVDYLLYSSRDFFVYLRPTGLYAIRDFFAKDRWEPVAFLGDKILLRRGRGSMDPLFQINPKDIAEPPILLEAKIDDLELRGIWKSPLKADGSKKMMEITFDLRCLKDKPGNYTMIVVLSDGSGEHLSVRSRSICYGFHPIVSLKAGDRVIEKYRLPLPADLSSDIELRIGLGEISGHKYRPFKQNSHTENGLAMISIFEDEEILGPPEA